MTCVYAAVLSVLLSVYPGLLLAWKAYLLHLVGTTMNEVVVVLHNR